MDIPTLDTARLHLRGFRRDDLDDSAALWGDADVIRYLGARPFRREEVWWRLLRHLGHWTLMGYGCWVVCERDSGRFVGEVGFQNLQRAIDPPLGEAPEIGWVLAPWAQGRGYATEAVGAAQAWIDPRYARTVCIMDPDNAASRRVADRCGYRPLATSTYNGDATLILARPA
jgi:RimJ/RimL family protein N-acetyltransferase